MPNSPEEKRRQYWRKNLIALSVLLSIWFLVSLGCGVLFSKQLDQFTLLGSKIKLGFWFAQQGSIYVFLLIIAAYVVIMNKLDKELLGDEGDDE